MLLRIKLKGKIAQQFFIASQPDKTLENKLILVLESNSADLDSSVFQGLEKFEIPKKVYGVPKFKMTTTGKIKRLETLKLIK